MQGSYREMAARCGLNRELFVVLVAGALAIQPAANAGEKRLTGDEIKSLFTGARIYWPKPSLDYWSTTPPIVQVDFKPGGIVEGLVGVGTTSGADVTYGQESGTWWVSGDMFCWQWNSWWEGRRGCFSISFDGEKARWYRGDGELAGEAKLAR